MDENRLRTNQHFTFKQNPLTRADLDEFVACFNPENRHARTPTWSEDTPEGRWRAFTYDELLARDKVNLDIFWLRDESLEEAAGPTPTCWPLKSWKTCKLPSNSFGRLPRIWKHGRPATPGSVGDR